MLSFCVLSGRPGRRCRLRRRSWVSWLPRVCRGGRREGSRCNQLSPYSGFVHGYIGAPWPCSTSCLLFITLHVLRTREPWQLGVSGVRGGLNQCFDKDAMIQRGGLYPWAIMKTTGSTTSPGSKVQVCVWREECRHARALYMCSQSSVPCFPCFPCHRIVVCT